MRGSAKKRRAALLLFQPHSEIRPAPAPAVSPPADLDARKAGSAGGASGGFHQHEDFIMTAAKQHAEPASSPAPAPTSRYEPNVSTANNLSKISVGELFGELPEMRRGDDTRWLCDLYLHVMGSEVTDENSRYGEYTKWLGDHRAIRLDTGEVVKSAVAILPNICNERIKAAMGLAANNADGRAQNVMLGFRLGVTSEGRRLGSKGYRYLSRDITPVEYPTPAIDAYIEAAHGSAARAIAHDPDAASEALPNAAE
jgi:hypothetical protein